MAGQLRITGTWIRSRPVTAEDAGKQFKIVDLPAGALVVPGGVFLQVLEGFGGVGSVQIGEADNPGSWIDTTSIMDPGTVPSVAGGKLYTAPGALYATLGAGLTTGKAIVLVKTLDLSDLVG